MADTLAKQAIHTGTLTTFSLPVADAIKAVNLQQGVAKPKTHPWFHHKHIHREELSIINKIKLHIAHTPDYLHKIHKLDSHYCDCGEYGTINHLLLQCPKYHDERHYINSYMSKQTQYGPWSIESLIATNESTWGRILRKYLMKCKMKL